MIAEGCRGHSITISSVPRFTSPKTWTLPHKYDYCVVLRTLSSYCDILVSDGSVHSCLLGQINAIIGFMALLTRLHNLFVISRDPIYKWRVEWAECPLCGPSLFVALSSHPIQIRCLRCREAVINLATVAVVKQVPTGSAFELSTYGATFEYTRTHFHPFECSEYFPGAKPGELIDGVRNEDVQQLSFSDNSFDLITSNQVFEHVPDYLRAFKECLRCLKPGGSLVFTVPMHDAPKTQENAKLENGKVVWVGVPEYHGSRIGGPNSTPVFWRFSVHDVVLNVLAAGFKSAELVSVFLCSQQKHPQHVIRALK